MKIKVRYFLERVGETEILYRTVGFGDLESVAYRERGWVLRNVNGWVEDLTILLWVDGLAGPGLVAITKAEAKQIMRDRGAPADDFDK